MRSAGTNVDADAVVNEGVSSAGRVHAARSMQPGFGLVLLQRPTFGSCIAVHVGMVVRVHGAMCTPAGTQERSLARTEERRRSCSFQRCLSSCNWPVQREASDVQAGALAPTTLA